jgi:signal recognition particle subunit SRP54
MGKKARGKTAAPARKVRGKSGNPAKRAAQEKAALEGRPATTAPSGSAFGLGAAQPRDVDPADLQLPAGFDKLLGR